MKKKGLFATGIMVLMVTVMTFSAWAVPPVINYQGTLTDADGNPLDGSYLITFYIYDAATAGGELWHEEQTVVVGEGIYNVRLGAVTPFPADLFDKDLLYVEVVIHNPDTGLDEILSPRQRLTSTPFAMEAGDAETLEGWYAGDFAPLIHYHNELYYTQDQSNTRFVNTDEDSMTSSVSGSVLSISNTGTGVGLHAEASGSYGSGVYGYASHTGDVQNYGGYFVAQGTYGRGVYGSASGTSGRGVHGLASNNEDVENYGGYFVASGTYGRGVYRLAQGTFGRGVYGEGSGTYGRGVVGNGNSYDFFAMGDGTNYGLFTGGHEVKLSDDFAEDVKPGMIVSVTGEAKIRQREDGTVSISSTLPTVALSKVAYDKTVFGVFGGASQLHKEHWYQSKDGERFGKVNALGEGRVWVSNINGEIEAGDYITTSSIPGYGQRQADDLLHSYTLGKATETINWDSVTEVLEIDGQLFKIYLIAVVYTSG